MRNTIRAAATRKKLLQAARMLFARDGYAESSTEAVLQIAGVTRGALYHHFADKAALLDAICVEINTDAAAAVERAVAGIEDPMEALERGLVAWLDHVLAADVRRLLLVEAPTVLGWSRWMALDAAGAVPALRQGVKEATAVGALRFDGSPDALATMLNGAVNALALGIAAGESEAAEEARRAIRALLAALSAR